MKKLLFICLGLGSIILQADFTNDIEYCKQFQKNEIRLNCYDKISKNDFSADTHIVDSNKAKQLYKRCSACHGLNAEKKALGSSAIIAGWDIQKLKNALLGYKYYSYGGTMRGVMKGQVASLSDQDINALAIYIHGLSQKSVINNKSDTGKWHEVINVDPMTDKEIVILSLNADNQIHTQYTYQSFTPSLYIRCKDKKTEAYINWGTYLGLDTTQVTIRIDKQRKVTQTWGLSTDNKATFSPSGYSFSKKILKHKKLIASTVPYGDNPVTTIFNIEGFENASKNLRKHCGW